MTEPDSPETDQPSVAVTVVVVTWQGEHLLDDCLDSLAAQTSPHRVLVVDNASSDGTAALLARRRPAVEVITLDSNAGFAGGVAAALPSIRTPYLALLNNDAAADPGWLQRSLETMRAHPDVAGVAARMLFWDGALINNAGVSLVAGGYGTDRGLGQPDGAPYDEAAEVFGFSGGAALLRTDAVRDAGGMAAEFFLYYEDTDLAWRMRLAGWRVRYEPSAVVRHRHGATTDLTSQLFAFHTERNRLLMLLRCAPASYAIVQLLRFCLTTASLQARRLARQNVGDAQVFALGLRLRVVGSTLRLLPAAVRFRRRFNQHVTVSRRALVRYWIPR